MNAFGKFAAAALGAGTACIVAVGGMAMAAGNADPEIHACAKARGVDEGQRGALRVVGSTEDCKKNETAISWNREGVAGARGPAGPAGAAGPAGPTGPAGGAGPQGERGTAGPAGPGGLQGDRGEPGPAGPQGAQGDAGPAGPRGETGLTGAQGPQGETGPAGPQGEPGPAGAGGQWVELDPSREPSGWATHDLPGFGTLAFTCGVNSEELLRLTNTASGRSDMYWWIVAENNYEKGMVLPAGWASDVLLERSMMRMMITRRGAMRYAKEYSSPHGLVVIEAYFRPSEIGGSKCRLSFVKRTYEGS